MVYKQFLSAIRTQLGVTYSFNSGRPYNDPNVEEFNSRMTKYYNEFSFNFSYLYRPNIILYASASNIFGRDNIFGYEYANEPDDNGFFNRRAIGQQARRFFFIGVFITFTKDGIKNNLENL